MSAVGRVARAAVHAVLGFFAAFVVTWLVAILLGDFPGYRDVSVSELERSRKTMRAAITFATLAGTVVAGIAASVGGRSVSRSWLRFVVAWGGIAAIPAFPHKGSLLPFGTFYAHLEFGHPGQSFLIVLHLAVAAVVAWAIGWWQATGELRETGSESADDSHPNSAGSQRGES